MSAVNVSAAGLIQVEANSIRVGRSTIKTMRADSPGFLQNAVRGLGNSCIVRAKSCRIPLEFVTGILGSEIGPPGWLVGANARLSSSRRDLQRLRLRRLE